MKGTFPWVTAIKDLVCIAIAGFMFIHETLRESPRPIILGLGTLIIGVPIGSALRVLTKLPALTELPSSQSAPPSPELYGPSNTSGQ